MNVVILSCNTGGGHNAAAKALQETFSQAGDCAEVLDYLSLAGPLLSKTVGGSYVKMVQHTPKAFGAVYDIGMVMSTHTQRSPVYYANAVMANYLRDYFAMHNIDLVVMTHLFAAETITWMKRHQMPLPPTLFISTDYTCIPFVEETDCDTYIIPHESLTAECVARGMPSERLYPLGIPVSMSLLNLPSRNQARNELNLPQDKRLLLVVGGSMGAGDLGRLSSDLLRLIDSSMSLVVICGSNVHKREKLEAKFRRQQQVQVFGPTNAMPTMMAACDIIFTKPGGLTSTEAAAAGLLLVHTTPIPGCETANRDFFTKNGLSVSGPTTYAQARAGVALLRSAAESKAMRQRQLTFLHGDATQRICELAHEIAHKK